MDAVLTVEGAVNSPHDSFIGVLCDWPEGRRLLKIARCLANQLTANCSAIDATQSALAAAGTLLGGAADCAAVVSAISTLDEHLSTLDEVV